MQTLDGGGGLHCWKFQGLVNSEGQQSFYAVRKGDETNGSTTSELHEFHTNLCSIPGFSYLDIYNPLVADLDRHNGAGAGDKDTIAAII